MTADEYTARGYRRVSRKYGMLARIDRPDWREHMAGQHVRGMEWVDNLGSGAADHYRRVYSRDRIEIDPTLALQVPTSGWDEVGYVPALKKAGQ